MQCDKYIIAITMNLKDTGGYRVVDILKIIAVALI